MTHTISADAWVATAHGDPTKVLERRRIDVRPPGPSEVRVEVSTFCANLRVSFDDLPAAMEREERRETAGRTVVRAKSS
jgi:hypothetical protein